MQMNRIVWYFKKIFIITLFLSWSTGYLFAQEESGKTSSTDPLVNRRVLILDFINVNNNAEYSYLEGSIPESFLDPLSKTKSFELLLRTTWAKYVTQERFDKADAYKEETAIEAGKLAGADVVVIGQFVAMTDHIQLYAKAIEVSSGRVMVAYNSAAPLDNDLFNAIEKMANQMSSEMKKKLPPLPQKIIIEQRIKYVDNEKESSKAIARRARTEQKAAEWRRMESDQARKFRAMESEQALRYRMMQSKSLNYQEQYAIISASYRSQPFGLRLFGNSLFGIFSGGAMGLVSGFGFGTGLPFNETMITVGISSGVAALIGFGTGIWATFYDMDHLDQPIIGHRLLLNSWLWYGLGAVVGTASGIGIGFLQNPYSLNVNSTAMLNGMAIGSVTGLAIGIFLTFLPQMKFVPPEQAKNLSFNFNGTGGMVAYTRPF